MDKSKGKISISSLIENVFGNASLYSILGINKSDSSEIIKRAYRKMALRYHPDKGGSAEQFQALSAVNAILTDPAKRKHYDKTGSIDLAVNRGDDIDDMFPDMFKSAMGKFTTSYVNSDMERKDIVSGYKKYKGNLQKVMQKLLFCDIESTVDRERIISIIDYAIQTGELDSLPGYTTSRGDHSDISKQGYISPDESDYEVEEEEEYIPSDLEDDETDIFEAVNEDGNKRGRPSDQQVDRKKPSNCIGSRNEFGIGYSAKFFRRL